MERVRISKTKYYTVADMYYNIYRVNVQVTFDGSDYYRTVGFYVAGDDEAEAKSAMGGFIAKHKDIAPTKFEDESGWNAFVDAIYDEIAKDELQSIYIHYDA